MQRILLSVLGALFATVLATSVHGQITVSFEGEGFEFSTGFETSFSGSYTLPQEGGIVVETPVPSATGYQPAIDSALSTMTIEGIGTSVANTDDPIIVAVSSSLDLWIFAGGAYAFPDEGFGCILQFVDSSGDPISDNEYFVLDSLEPSWRGTLLCFTPPAGNLVFLGFLSSLECESGCVKANAGLDRAVECTGPDGAFVMLDGSDSIPTPLEGGTYIWSIGGAEIGEGAEPDVLLGLGEHVVTLTVSDADGLSDTDIVQITVEDTDDPLVSADMVQAGEEGHKYDIVATATDVCDSAPTVESTIGTFVSDGGSIVIAQPDEEGLVRVKGSMPSLEVTATDASGNTATETASP